MEQIHKQLGKEVEFITIYLREAHPADGWRTPGNDRAGIIINQPITLQERCSVASRCYQALGLGMKMVVDEMDDRVSRAYCAEPDRLYVIDRAGRIAYRGANGPFGFNPNEMLQSLSMLLIDEANFLSSVTAGQE